MKRFLLCCCLLVCPLGAPTSALAASTSGTISLVGQSFFTIQMPGRPVRVLRALTAAADSVTQGDYPYVWGGGHTQAGIASVGIKGPGHNNRRVGFDCSGAVAAVLSGAGLWPQGAGVPNDAGVIAQLLRAHLIARGAGQGPIEVTLYDRPGTHIFMNIDGRFFGTSDGGGGGNPRGGAGWLDDGAPDAYSHAFKRYHLLPSVLKASTDAGHAVAFQIGAIAGVPIVLVPGEKAQVTYQQTRAGTLLATAVDYPDAQSATGVVQSIASDGSALTIQTSDGASLSFQTSTVPQLLQGVAVGDSIQVSYVTGGAALIPIALGATATPPAPPLAG